MKKIVAIILCLSLLCCSCAERPVNNEPAKSDTITNESVKSESVKRLIRGEITNEMREYFFDLVLIHRVDAMPTFEQGEQPDELYLKSYVANLYRPNGVLSKERFEYAVLQKFGIDYKSKDIDLTLKPESYADYPFVEVVDYSEEKTDEGTIVTATVAKYVIQEFMYLGTLFEKPKELFEYRQQIIEGTCDISQVNNFYTFKYLTKDGKYPEKFLSKQRIAAGGTEFEECYKKYFGIEFKVPDTW